ncbi:MAG: FtsW/RodA/SpoVE family cell cycle protein [Acidimicrobiales bacterium]
MSVLAITPKFKPRRRSELGLLAVAILTVIFAYLLESLAVENRIPPNIVAFIIATVLIALVCNVVNRRLVPNADPILIPIVLLLNGLGYVMLSRLAPFVSGGHHLVAYQAIWSVLGIVAYIATLLVIRRSRDLERYRYLTLLAAIVLLVLPLLPHLGNSPNNTNGVRLWVDLGPITFQPVEISKLLLVIFFASYFVEKQELLSMATHRIGNRLVPDLRPFGPIAFAWLCSVAVILLERDIGFSLLLFFMFLAMLWVTTGRWTYLLLGVIAFVVGTYFASILLHQVNARIAIWLNPWKDVLGSGYQPVMGELGLARGGISGTGLGLGLPYNIPVSTSDFIFAAFGEELGLIGGTALVAAFVLITGSGLRAALRARSEFSKLAALGFTVVIGFQAFFIMAGVARLLPLTGVTLPFVSYGGSSLVANYILVAFLMRISNEGSQNLPGLSDKVPLTAALAPH